MSSNIGWYHLEEHFNANGEIDIAIKDKRTGEIIAFTVETLEGYDDLINFLDNNRSIGALQKYLITSNK